MTAMIRRRTTAPATAKIATGLLSSPKIDRTRATRESREKPTTIYAVHSLEIRIFTWFLNCENWGSAGVPHFAVVHKRSYVTPIACHWPLAIYDYDIDIDRWRKKYLRPFSRVLFFNTAELDTTLRPRVRAKIGNSPVLMAQAWLKGQFRPTSKTMLLKILKKKMVQEPTFTFETWAKQRSNVQSWACLYKATVPLPRLCPSISPRLSSLKFCSLTNLVT